MTEEWRQLIETMEGQLAAIKAGDVTSVLGATALLANNAATLAAWAKLKEKS